MTGDPPPARPGRRGAGQRATIFLAGTMAAGILLSLQVKLVGDAFAPLPGTSLPVSLQGLATGPGPVIADAPFVVVTSAPTVSAAAAAVPRDLTGWALGVSAAVGVPPVALAAYGAAQLELAAASPECRLSWPTLAGIGLVESDHGRYGGAVLGADGHSTPPIMGVALDGGPGIARIADTDGGALDGDSRLDRAVGPMQFIPGTWATWHADGDGDGRQDPFDIDDAARAAAHYLCAAGGDLATGTGWTRAVYAYNASDRYVLDVRAAADAYAARSAAR